MILIQSELQEFILFCIKRHGSEWPGIYDEMVNVASQRLFRGLGYDELKCLGLSFAASNATILKQIVDYVSARSKNLYL